MKTRLLIVSVALAVSACTSSSSLADVELDDDATISSSTTSGVLGEVEADELPLVDGDDGAGEVDPGPDTPDGENTEAPNGSIPSEEPGQDDSGASASDEGEVTDQEQDSDAEVAAASAALTACAIVEAGYIAALDGEGNVTDLYARGGQAAIDSQATSYQTLGQELLDAAASADASSKADTFLDQCAADGFERLAG